MTLCLLANWRESLVKHMNKRSLWGIVSAIPNLRWADRRTNSGLPEFESHVEE